MNIVNLILSMVFSLVSIWGIALVNADHPVIGIFSILWGAIIAGLYFGKFITTLKI